mmetsp:Transcript_1188/g.2587  ORF Transcript_1188/g.2587 Transcript_1188/m.2587 type:complete len:222 (-) Transcript_1188:483-1148(-)
MQSTTNPQRTVRMIVQSRCENDTGSPRNLNVRYCRFAYVDVIAPAQTDEEKNVHNQLNVVSLGCSLMNSSIDLFPAATLHTPKFRTDEKNAIQVVKKTFACTSPTDNVDVLMCIAAAQYRTDVIQMYCSYRLPSWNTTFQKSGNAIVSKWAAIISIVNIVPIPLVVTQPKSFQLKTGPNGVIQNRASFWSVTIRSEMDLFSRSPSKKNFKTEINITADVID